MNESFKSNCAPLTDSFARETTAVGEWRDTKLPGFRFKHTKAGNKVWFVENVLHGSRKTITITLGRFPMVLAKDARMEANRLLSQLRQGIDPRIESIEKQREQKEKWEIESQSRKLTLEAVLIDYLARKNLKEGTISNYRIVAKAYLSDWMNRQLVDISKNDVEDRFHKISRCELRSKKGGPGAANNTMRVLRALFTFATEMYEAADGQPIVLHNPVKRLNQLKAWNKLKRRQTVLTEIDLPAWYSAVESLDDRVIADYLLFVLLSGLRKNEAAKLKWQHVYTKHGYFEVVNTKNRCEFALPLTGRIIEITERRRQERFDLANPYVFPGKGKNGFLNLRNKDFDEIVRQTGVSFGLHDLRRTYLTQGFFFGLDLDLLKKLANHKSNSSDDVTQGYLIVRAKDLLNPMEKVGERLWFLMKDSQRDRFY